MDTTRVPRKVLWVAATLVVAVIFIGLIFFLTRKEAKKDCRDVLYEPLKDYIIPQENFDKFKWSFKNVWVGKKLFMSTKCSYFTIREDGGAMESVIGKSGVKNHTLRLYLDQKDGVIDIRIIESLAVFPKKNAGRIFPIFANNSVLGNVFCDEVEGNIQSWRPVISVNVTSYDAITDSTVKDTVQMFKDIEAKVGLDLGLGEFYHTTCFEEPVWPEEDQTIRL